jgi:hypothetical protein
MICLTSLCTTHALHATDYFFKPALLAMDKKLVALQAAADKEEGMPSQC